MRVAVTGGAGFIGSSVVRELSMRIDVSDIRVIDNLTTGRWENIEHLPVELAHVDIRDRSALEKAVSGCSSVIHLAALPSVPRSIADPLTSHEVNATGTLNVAEACKRVCAQLVYASSSSVYGQSVPGPKNELGPVNPASPYAASKLAGEAYARAYRASFAVPGVAFRFFNVYGPRQTLEGPYAAVIPAFIRAILAGDAVQVYGDGEQTRDFTFVSDVARVLAQTAVLGLDVPQPINLAFGTPLSLNEIIKMIGSEYGREVAAKYLPQRKGDIARSQADPAYFRLKFPGITPTPFAEGLRQTINYYAGRG